MKQHTLVAFYGEKQGNLLDLIQGIHSQILRSSLRDFFRPYDLDQIHATIVGMEKIPGEDPPFNLNVWKKKGHRVPIDPAGIENTLMRFLPMNLQFGGFPEDFEGFRSLGKRLFERTFELDWSSGKAVLIGWPVDARRQPTERLLQVRDTLYQQHQILHKYEGDKDCYLVIGRLGGLDRIDASTNRQLKSAKQELEEKIWQYLSVHLYHIPLEFDQLSVVQYTDTTLPRSKSQAWPLDQIERLFE